MKMRDIIIIAGVILAVILLIGLKSFVYIEDDSVKEPEFDREAINEMANYYHDYRINTFEILNKFQKDVDTVFIGDSITENYNVYEFFTGNIVNRGIGGDTVDGLLQRMESSVLDLNPNKVVFMMGTNDIAAGATEDEILSRINSVLTIIKNELPETKIIVQSLYPVYEKESEKVSKMIVGVRTNSQIDEINEKIRTLTSKLNIQYVDVNSHLKDDNGQLNLDYTIEGLHLNLKGYEVVTEVLKPYVNDDK